MLSNVIKVVLSARNDIYHILVLPTFLILGLHHNPGYWPLQEGMNGAFTLIPSKSIPQSKLSLENKVEMSFFPILPVMQVGESRHLEISLVYPCGV